MDDIQAFMELSALLTGLNNPLLNDPEDRELNKPVAEEYARRLKAYSPRTLDGSHNSTASEVRSSQQRSLAP
jgi:hypothetical protein